MWATAGVALIVFVILAGAGWFIFRLSRWLVATAHQSELAVGIFGVNIRAVGPVTFVVLFAGGVVLGALLLHWGYVSWSNAYSVAFDSPEVGVPLDVLRAKYQRDTATTILIADRAKKFLVKGRFEGDCVPALFDAICRQYASDLACKTSWLQTRVTVDLAK